MGSASDWACTGPVRLAFLSLLALAGGCLSRADSTSDLELVWGRRGISDGRLQKPRAIASSSEREVQSDRIVKLRMLMCLCRPLAIA